MLVIRQATEKSPLITLDGNIMTVAGRSFMENSREFYKNLFLDIQKCDFSDMLVVVKIDYFNSNSSKWLLEFFYLVAEKKGSNTHIIWKYTKSYPEMKEYGEDFRNSLGRLIPFDIVEELEDN